MANDKEFDVFVSGGNTSVDEYRRAMVAPKSELPELTEQQKLVAKRLGLSEEEYRRGVLADEFGHSRMLERGKRLGEVIQGVFDGLGGKYHVEAIKAEMVNLRWLVRIASADREVVADIPRALADDAVDSGASEQVERLKSCLLSSLRRGELAAKD